MVFAVCLFAACLSEAGSPPGAVVAWGWNGYGQTDVPPGMTNVVAVVAGGYHSLALQSNGVVVAWGDNSYGQTNVPPGLSNVVAIAAGGLHSLALLSRGTVAAWGWNAYGQTNVPRGLSSVAAIAAGGDHSLALRSNGTVVAWGYNSSGQTNVPPGLSNVVAIAGGNSDSLALSNGSVLAWGTYWNGSAEVPMTVPAGLSNVVAIAAGGDHSLALRSDGTVVAWGYNNSGQTNVPPGLSNVVAIAAGDSDSLAVQSNGVVVAWGDNSYGQTNVPPVLSNVVAIAAGYYHNLAITVGPVIWSQSPSAISLAPGAGTNLSVTVRSGSSFGCQWSFNAGPIKGETQTNLAISNFDLTQAGVYSVTVTNYYSYATAASVVRLTNSPVILVDGIDVGGGAVTQGDFPQISMSSTFGPSGEIYYTLDGTEPDYTSIPYSGAFTLTDSVPINAIAYSSAYTNWAEAAAIYVQIVPPYPLSVSTSGDGSVSVSPPPYGGSNLYVSNTLVTLTATPSKGWAFVGWTGDSTATTNVTTLVMNQPRTVQASFWPTYPLATSTSGGGSVSAAPAPYSGSSLYVSNTLVTLTATPSTDWAFVGWTGNSTATTSVTTLVMNQSSAVQAVFWPTYSLSASTPGGGSVSVSPAPYSGGNLYISNTTVTLTATNSNGWVFLGWMGDITATTNVTTVVMEEPLQVQAVFGTSLDLFTSGSGQVLLNPTNGPYPFGSTVQLTALPSAGYYLFGWANAASGFANPLLFTVTNATPGITALFGALKSDQVSLTVLPIGNGTITINPATNFYTNSETVHLTAVPATSYDFTGWGGDASGKTNRLDLSLSTSMLITASFVVSRPVFQTVEQVAGGIAFTWSAVTGQTYQVQYKTDLGQADWTSLGSPVTATNSTMAAGDSIASAPSRRFYRVALVP
jgi:uncharacterized repeat protein (TIGR02543 family)